MKARCIGVAAGSALLLCGCAYLSDGLGKATTNLYLAQPVVLYSTPAHVKTRDDGISGPLYLDTLTMRVCPGGEGSLRSPMPQASSAPPSSTATAPSGGAQRAQSDDDAARKLALEHATMGPERSSKQTINAGAGSASTSSAPGVTTPDTGGTVAAFGGGDGGRNSGNSQCVSVVAYDAALSDPTGGARNRLLTRVVDQSNQICSEIKAQIIGTNDILNFGLGNSTTVLAGAASIVTGVTPARILSGTAAITNATRSQMNEIFYANALKAAILKTIDDLRTAELPKLIGAATDKTNGNPVSLERFSVEDMLSEVRRYHNMCSFYVGVTGLSQAGTTPSSDNIREISTAIHDAITEALNKSATSSAPSTAGDADHATGKTTLSKTSERSNQRAAQSSAPEAQ